MFCGSFDDPGQVTTRMWDLGMPAVGVDDDDELLLALVLIFSSCFLHWDWVSDNLFTAALFFPEDDILNWLFLFPEWGGHHS